MKKARARFFSSLNTFALALGASKWYHIISQKMLMDSGIEISGNLVQAYAVSGFFI